MDIRYGPFDLPPAEEPVGGLGAEQCECFWGAEEPCAEGDGGYRTEGGEFCLNL